MLERNGRGVRLTDAAQLLVGHADRMLQLVERAEADLEARHDAVVGRLSAAAFATAVRGLGATALRSLRVAHPDLRVELSEQERGESVPAVARGEIDLAIAQDWFDAPLPLPGNLARADVLDVVDAALAAEHPLAPCRTRHHRARRRAMGELAARVRLPQLVAAYAARVRDRTGRRLRRGRTPNPARPRRGWDRRRDDPRLGRGPAPEGVRIVPVDLTRSRRIYPVWRERRPPTGRRGNGRRPAGRRVIGSSIPFYREFEQSVMTNRH
jgi:DNA-binding transcriptional LysR family regulator